MSLSLRLALRYALARPARTLVTALGVLAGTAGLQAIDLGTRGTLDAVRLAYEEAAGPAALMVTPAGDTSAALPPGTLDKVRREPGVAAVLPLVQVATTRVEELNAWAAPLFPGEVTGVLVLGVDFAQERGRGRLRVPEGAEPDGRAVLVGETWARERSLKPGSTLRLVAGDGVLTLQITGLAAREGLGAKHYGQVIIAPLAEVQRAFSMGPDEVNEAAVVLAPDAPVEEVASRLQQVLGAGATVLRPAERGKDVVQRLGNIRAGTDLTSSIALFLASFLIYSMFATAAAERRRDTAMLRCIGATKRQAALPLLVEAVLVAVPGAILGAALGSQLAAGVSATLSRTAGAELRIPTADLAGMVRSGAIGMAVAFASALLPALRGAAQPPFDGLRARGSAAEPPSGAMTLGWATAVVLALALLVVIPPAASAPARTYGLVLLLIGGCAGLLPAAMGPVTRTLSGMALRLLGGGGALGVAVPRWRPVRSGLAAGAVLGCIALVGALSSLGAGFRQQFGDWADHALGWDLFVRRPSGLSREAIAQVRQTPGVRYVSPGFIRPAEIVTADGRRVSLSVVGVDPEVYARDGTFLFVPGTQGDPAEIVRSLQDGRSALVTGVLAGQLNVRSGTEVTLESPAGPRKLRLTAEIVDYTQNGFAIVVADKVVEESFAAVSADVATVRLEAGASVDAVTAALSAIPGIRVEGRAALKARVMRAVNDSVGAMDALLWLSALVGFLAIWAAVALGAIERRADIAALRSLGMSRRQVAVMICTEALVTALVGAVGGFALAIYLGWVFVESTHRLGIPLLYLPPWRALVWAVLGAVLSSVPAALLPARRAAAIPPSEALRDA